MGFVRIGSSYGVAVEDEIMLSVFVTPVMRICHARSRALSFQKQVEDIYLYILTENREYN